MGVEKICEKVKWVSTREPKIRPVWISAICSVGNGPSVQAVAGQSEKGFHPGLRHFGEKSMEEHWGGAMPTRGEAVRASQEAAASTLRVQGTLLPVKPIEKPFHTQPEIVGVPSVPVIARGGR